MPGPPPSVNRPASSRLAPASPNHDYDDLPGTEASPTSGRGGASSNKRQSIGRRQPRQEYTDDDEEAEQAAAAPASSRRYAPSDAAVSSRQRAVTEEEDEEADEADDSVDVEMGRNVMSGRSRGGISRRTEVRGSAETELGGQSEEDEAVARMALDPEGDGDDGMPANDYGGGVDDYDAGDQQDYRDGEAEPAGDEAEEEEPHQPLRKARGRPKKGKGKATETTGKENRPPPRPRASPKQARGQSEVLEREPNKRTQVNPLQITDMVPFSYQLPMTCYLSDLAFVPWRNGRHLSSTGGVSDPYSRDPCGMKSPLQRYSSKSGNEFQRRNPYHSLISEGEVRRVHRVGLAA